MNNLNEITQLVSHWELTSEEIQKILGSKFQNELSDSVQHQRVSKLLRINELLVILYPNSRHAGYIRSSNTYFEGKSLIDLLLNDFDNGCNAIMVYLQAAASGGHFL